jgi:hypothetical protein
MSGPEKKQPANAVEIIKDYLERNGFDGIYDDSCGCGCITNDIRNHCVNNNCRPGYKGPCGNGFPGFKIGPKKEEDKP